MTQFAFPLGDRPALTIRSHADLRVTGWERPEASVDSEPGYSLKVEQGQTGLRVTCLDDCEIFIPTTTMVTIEKVTGDVRVANLSGALTIEKVDGSAVFTQVGAVSVDKINGDCDVNGVAGAFTVSRLGGSLDGSQFGGDVVVEKAGGDIQTSGICGRFLARAGGSIQVQLSEGFGPAIQLRAGGDIRLHLPGQDHGRYTLTSGGEDIRIDLEGMLETVEHKVYEFNRGQQPGREVELRAGGAISLSAQPLHEVASNPAQSDTARQKHSVGWPGITRSTEEAISRAARSAEEALRQAERRVSAALRGLEGRATAREEDPAAPAVGASEGASDEAATQVAPTTQPEIQLDDSAVVSDQERLLILKMLQAKKITIDEAEALLEALGNPG